MLILKQLSALDWSDFGVLRNHFVRLVLWRQVSSPLENPNDRLAFNILFSYLRYCTVYYSTYISFHDQKSRQSCLVLYLMYKNFTLIGINDTTVLGTDNFRYVGCIDEVQFSELRNQGFLIIYIYISKHLKICSFLIYAHLNFIFFSQHIFTVDLNEDKEE